MIQKYVRNVNTFNAGMFSKPHK